MKYENKTSLGWKITNRGEYIINLPRLSNDEVELIYLVDEEFSKIASERKIESAEVEKIIVELVEKVAKSNNIYLDRDQKEYLVKYSKLHIYGFAFLDELIKDNEIEEISIIAPNKEAYVYIKKKGWLKVNAYFEDEKTIMETINKIAKTIGRRITLQQPRIDAILPDGSRLHASIPPISNGEITIRKFRSVPFSPKEIVDSNVITVDLIAFLSCVMQSDLSLIIAGNTASGKTTTLNSLFTFVPANERILITEETPEINLKHEHQIRLIANRELGIGLKELVYDSLRMRPDRVIVGEVRSKEEIEALFDVLLSGQARGMYATFHAQNSEEALLRIKRMGISDVDLPAIDLILIQRRILYYDSNNRKASEVRKVLELAEVNKSGLYRIYTQENEKLELERSNTFYEIARNFNMSEKELKEEIEIRKKWITSLSSDFDKFFAEWQKMCFGLSNV